jgi:hypothetical protein
MMMRKLLLAATAVTLALAGSAHAETHVCRGLVTANWTEGVEGVQPDDGSRLIRADQINSSCLFKKNSAVGKKILAVCKMGLPCEAKIKIDNSEPADVYVIDRVYTVKSLVK